MQLPWEFISLKINDGYFGSQVPIITKCTNDGQLYFNADDSPGARIILKTPDNSQSLSNEELSKLNRCIQQFRGVNDHWNVGVLDGGSFDLSVKPKDQKLWKLHCYHSFGDPKLDRAMAQMRKLLKEDYFLEKYGEMFRSYSE